MIIVKTPFRIPLGGGGTDLPAYYSKYGGSLLTATINKYMVITISESKIVDRIIVHYSKREEVGLDSIHRIEHDLVREALIDRNWHSPLEISSTADFPAGTGMGSSGSYAVGLLNGLNHLQDRTVSSEHLAEEACRLEIELAGKMVGKQDQYAAAFGGVVHLTIDLLGEVIVKQLDLGLMLNKLESQLVMFYTKVQRDANVILSEQSKKLSFDEKLATESMHRIKKIGEESLRALISGEIERYGELMHEHWKEKKNVSAKMSNPFINDVYEAGMQAGALGGKLMGAGGGGFLLFVVEEGMRESVIHAVKDQGFAHVDFRFEGTGSTVVNLE